MRKQITPEITNEVTEELGDELIRRIKQKGDLSFTSTHEILGVLEEEFDEVHEAVHQNNHQKLKKELQDIIVGAFWGLCSIEAEALDW